MRYAGGGLLKGYAVRKKLGTTVFKSRQTLATVADFQISTSQLNVRIGRTLCLLGIGYGLEYFTNRTVQVYIPK